MSPRSVVAAVLLALVVAGAGVVFVADATHDGGWCARTLETIQVGAGPVLVPLEPLHGITYWDLPYPDCSSGRFNIDHTSDPVQTEQHCDEGFLRVFAGPGETGIEFVVNWLPAGGGCA